jgi:hypothetical protein
MTPFVTRKSDTVRTRSSSVSTLASFAVESGRAGLVRDT